MSRIVRHIKCDNCSHEEDVYWSFGHPNHDINYEWKCEECGHSNHILVKAWPLSDVEGALGYAGSAWEIESKKE